MGGTYAALLRRALRARFRSPHGGPIRVRVSDPSDVPIRPLLFDDTSQAQLDAFVVALGERIDAIQDAEHLGRLDEVGKRASELAVEAAKLGLPPLAIAAESVAATCRSGDAPRARAEIVELTDVVRRVRLGHRSTAPS
jgi:hypothetical protein